jgi:hypothetical protein
MLAFEHSRGPSCALGGGERTQPGEPAWLRSSPLDAELDAICELLGMICLGMRISGADRCSLGTFTRTGQKQSMSCYSIYGVEVKGYKLMNRARRECRISSFVCVAPADTLA